MKRVTLTYIAEFEDDMSDEECVSCAIECLSQNRNFPNDDQVKIEQVESQD